MKTKFRIIRMIMMGMFLFCFIGFLDAQKIYKSGNCENGFGVAKYSSTNNSKYEGYWKGGLRNGYGSFTNYWGDLYSGNWYNDTLDDYAIINWVNGNKYAGGFADDKFHGYGIMLWNDSSVYIGEYKHGFFSGYGILIPTNNRTIRSGIWEKGDIIKTIDQQEVKRYILDKYNYINYDNYSTAIINNEVGEEILFKQMLDNKIVMHFDNNSVTLSDSDYNKIVDLISNTERFKDLKISINGYTDNTGSEAYNKKISLKRANSLRSFFIDNNFDEKNIVTTGNGLNNPISLNTTEKGRNENRRVEITFFQ